MQKHWLAIANYSITDLTFPVKKKVKIIHSTNPPKRKGRKSCNTKDFRLILVRPTGIEPAVAGIGIRCIIRLCYGRIYSYYNIITDFSQVVMSFVTDVQFSLLVYYAEKTFICLLTIF